jgi:hypothetical protein
MITEDVKHIINDIKGAYGVKTYRTKSGYMVGGFKYAITKIKTPNDTIFITGYRRFFSNQLLDDIVGAYNHLTRTTYLYSPVEKKMTMIRKGRITYYGSCPVRVPSFQSLLMNIYMRRI